MIIFLNMNLLASGGARPDRDWIIGYLQQIPWEYKKSSHQCFVTKCGAIKQSKFEDRKCENHGNELQTLRSWFRQKGKCAAREMTIGAQNYPLERNVVMGLLTDSFFLNLYGVFYSTIAEDRIVQIPASSRKTKIKWNLFPFCLFCFFSKLAHLHHSWHFSTWCVCFAKFWARRCPRNSGELLSECSSTKKDSMWASNSKVRMS